MGFLALTAFSFGLAPLLFDLPHQIERSFDIINWVIIGLFALEYLLNLFLSDHRRDYVLDPWHLLDVVIILAPMLSLLPAAAHWTRSTPALRILLLFRILLFGPRIGHGLQKPPVSLLSPAVSTPPLVTRLRPGEITPHASDWDQLLQWAATPSGDWMHASSLSPERLKVISSVIGVPHVMIEAALQESSFPRIETGAHWTALTLSLPLSGAELHRVPVLLLISANSLLSLSTHQLDLQQAPIEIPDLPWGARCALFIIGNVLIRNEELAGRMERMVRQIEEMPAIQTPEGFFHQIFHLKHALSSAKGDLWRLHGMLEMLEDGRRKLPGLGSEQHELIDTLVEESDYLYETVDMIRESVLSLIELHLDVASYDTNRFMRLMAIVTTLALIPTMVGGLLGMNLFDAPWHVSIGQVSFGTLVLTLGVLYTFMAKGWIGGGR
jgi:Mg2+ and Co2+ transporter CorA